MSDVQWKPVDSSWIMALGWRGDPTRPGAVYLRPKKGKVTRYDGVRYEVFAAWLAARSKGVFYHQHIKERYKEA